MRETKNEQRASLAPALFWKLQQHSVCMRYSFGHRGPAYLVERTTNRRKLMINDDQGTADLLLKKVFWIYKVINSSVYLLGQETSSITSSMSYRFGVDRQEMALLSQKPKAPQFVRGFWFPMEPMVGIEPTIGSIFLIAVTRILKINSYLVWGAWIATSELLLF